jgi:ribosomal protein S18 acetylase RimI-like enzyme
MGVIIRKMILADRPAVGQMLVASRAFSEEEVQAALDILDAGLAGEAEDGYWLFVAETDAGVRGYVCVSRTPLTQSTWHLYWICVDPSAQRRGVGRALQAQAEQFIRERGGERMVLETSGRSEYERSRRFYEHVGYRATGRIRDYYRPGDDCVYYCKTLWTE